ncbi:ketopantoate reductase family protein [Streptomyces guryensis]|uniref:2-dehydropantoate 2-reductase n=1 Tax=Streptomyces guryensis TaxID=2886947 RepID=A0A9Q3VXR6_9ACTN|nr:ketopantoate reductase family protein [Streptomyces guryensis]MCD9878905.1 ketopantoate reductase family protein [Streptomyces guryensis]
MRALVVGAGATGGYFGGRLLEAGRDVTFLVRPGRAAQLSAHGLMIRSPHGSVRLAPKPVTARDLTEPYDLVLLTVKAYTLEQAVEDIAPAVGPRTVILPVLNGLRHAHLLEQKYGGHRVAGGVCLITTTLDPDGGVRQLGGQQELRYGPWQTPGPAALPALGPWLDGVGFTARPSPGIRQEMWEKWVYVAAVGAVTCLMRGLVGEVVAAPGGADFAGRVVAECAAVAAACGHPARAEALRRARATLTEPGSTTASSLYRDLLRGGPVEADHILGDLVERGAEHGVDTPLLGLAYTQLCVYQQALSRADRTGPMEV